MDKKNYSQAVTDLLMKHDQEYHESVHILVTEEEIKRYYNADYSVGQCVQKMLAKYSNQVISQVKT
jgi:hypothetical protein